MGLKTKAMGTANNSNNNRQLNNYCTNRSLSSAKRLNRNNSNIKHNNNTIAITSNSNNNSNSNSNNDNNINNCNQKTIEQHTTNNNNKLSTKSNHYAPVTANEANITDRAITCSVPICLGKRMQTIIKAETSARRLCTTITASSARSNSNYTNSTTNNIDIGKITAANTITTTYRSTSTSALYSVSLNVRPQTLNVHNQQITPTDHTQLFLGEVLNAWRAKARCNILPAERTQELFQELSFHPNDKQISEMLQTAKLLARKGRSNSNETNGLTFGEFCVFAADLKRFRNSCLSTPAPLLKDTNLGHELRTTKSLSNVDDCKNKDRSNGSPVEVFLGGSCNPTTWRADVAIPALKELGITFYNPQVSDWTPDLIELEHRAKEKARVLFFVMDSETRASAGAIEAAHIAGQNCKQLVLVLHPYKPNQSILNERISQQEYLDLSRNQLILKELVTRRGLPVLDNIPAGLQRTKEILYGFRDPPPNISSILVVVRGAFDRVNPIQGKITIEKCQQALLYLGYVQSLIDINNLKKIVSVQQNSLNSLECSKAKDSKFQHIPSTSTSSSAYTSSHHEFIDFNLFCVVFAYLSVLQQELHESGCISPIKGTNVPPPPVYLTNMQGEGACNAINYHHHHHYNSRNVSRNPSNTSIIGGSDFSGNNHQQEDHSIVNQNLNDVLSRSGDSGTSSPLPMEQSITVKYETRSQADKNCQPKLELIESNKRATTTAAMNASFPSRNNKVQLTSNITMQNLNSTEEGDENIEIVESDSNDSVFSSSNSSINSINCCSNEFIPTMSAATLDLREVYLGGSCYLRTRWRQDIAIPYLKKHNISYHLPTLHESLPSTQKSQNQQQTMKFNNIVKAKSNKIKHVRRRYNVKDNKEQNTFNKRQAEEIHEEEQEEISITENILEWSPLLPVSSNLYNPALLDSSRVLLFVITNETRSLAPMTLAAHCIGLMYNVVLAVQMLPNDCVIVNEKLTPTAIKDYNRGRSYLIDLAKRQGVPVFNDVQAALDCVVDKIKSYQSRRYE